MPFRSAAYTKGDPARARHPGGRLLLAVQRPLDAHGEPPEGDGAGRGDVQGPGRAAAPGERGPDRGQPVRGVPRAPGPRPGGADPGPVPAARPPRAPPWPRPPPATRRPRKAPTDEPPGPPPRPARRRTPRSSPPRRPTSSTWPRPTCRPPARRSPLGLVARAVRRHWWQAALIWLVGSVGLMALAYFKVKPTYLAFSRVRVEPASRGPLRPGSDGGNFAEFKRDPGQHHQPADGARGGPPGPPRAAHLPPARRGRRPDRRDPLDPDRGRRQGDQPHRGRRWRPSRRWSRRRSSTPWSTPTSSRPATSTPQETDEKIKQLDDARQEKDKEVTQKRNAIKELQKSPRRHRRGGRQGPQQRHDRGVPPAQQRAAARADRDRQGRGAARPAPGRAAGGRGGGPARSPRPTWSGSSTATSGSPRPSERNDRAEDKYKTVKEKVRNLADPSVQRPLKDMKEAQADLDALWKEMKPQLEAMGRRGIKQVGGGAADNPLKGAEAHARGPEGAGAEPDRQAQHAQHPASGPRGRRRCRWNSTGWT